MHAIMPRSAYGCIGVMLISICAVAPIHGADNDLPPFDVNQWLNGPDRRDFAWDAWIGEPLLNFQQRYFLTVGALIRGKRLPEAKSRRDLHFVLKVATAESGWIDGFSYTRVAVPSRLDGYQVITFADGVYLRPGRYTVALIVYDPLINKGNIYRKQVNLIRPKDDPLPELDRDLKSVEFRSDTKPLAEGKEWLPVNNNRCLCVDVIANTSVDYDYNPRLGYSQRYTSQRVYSDRGHIDSLDVMRVSSVFSHLGLQKGRVRVSVLDTLRMKTLFAREDAADFNWQRATEALMKQNHDTIDNELLASQTEASAFLRDRIYELLEDESCVSGSEPFVKIIIIVSSQMRFEKHTRILKIIPQNPASVRFVYFPLSHYMIDDLEKMLKPAKPLIVSKDTSFRRVLADLISYLEKIG